MKHPDENQTEGFKALWSIIHAWPTQDDLEMVCQELAGHDERIGAVHNIATMLSWMASTVSADCDQMSYEHGKEGDRYGDNPAAKDHYMSQVHYAYESARMDVYSNAVIDAHEADEELKNRNDKIDEDNNSELTAEQAIEEIEKI